MAKANSVTGGLDKMQSQTYSLTYQYEYDVLHFQKTTDSSNE